MARQPKWNKAHCMHPLKRGPHELPKQTWSLHSSGGQNPHCYEILISMCRTNLGMLGIITLAPGVSKASVPSWGGGTFRGSSSWWLCQGIWAHQWSSCQRHLQLNRTIIDGVEHARSRVIKRVIQCGQVHMISANVQHDHVLKVCDDIRVKQGWASLESWAFSLVKLKLTIRPNITTLGGPSTNSCSIH